MAYQSWWRLDYSINLRENSCQAIHSKKQSHNKKAKWIQERKILKIAKGTDDLMSTCDEAFDSIVLLNMFYFWQLCLEFFNYLTSMGLLRDSLCNGKLAVVYKKVEENMRK